MADKPHDFRLNLRLDPIEDADIIEKLQSAAPGKLSMVARRLLRAAIESERLGKAISNGFKSATALQLDEAVPPPPAPRPGPPRITVGIQEGPPAPTFPPPGFAALTKSEQNRLRAEWQDSQRIKKP